MSCLRDYTGLWPYGCTDSTWYIHEIQLARENSQKLGHKAKYGLYDVLSHVVLLTSLWVFRNFTMVIASWWDSSGIRLVRTGICFCLQERRCGQKWQDSWHILKDIAFSSPSCVIMWNRPNPACSKSCKNSSGASDILKLSCCTLITRVHSDTMLLLESPCAGFRNLKSTQIKASSRAMHFFMASCLLVEIAEFAKLRCARNGIRHLTWHVSSLFQGNLQIHQVHVGQDGQVRPHLQKITWKLWSTD